MEECQLGTDWPKWKEVMQSKLNSLMRQKVFGLVVQTPKGVKLVGYKWVFVQKPNEKKKEIISYKVRLVA